MPSWNSPGKTGEKQEKPFTMAEILIGYLPDTSQKSWRQGELTRCVLIHARIAYSFEHVRLLEARILYIRTWNKFTGLTFISTFILGINI
jgi:hypothetical protein